MTLMDCLEEARPIVLGIFLLRFMIAAIMAADISGKWNFGRLAGGAATWESAVFFVYLINGVMDVQEDRINRSGRPIARGALRRGTAANVAVAAAVLALGGAVALGMPVLLAVIALIAVGWQYSGPPLYLKRRPAGAPIACLMLGLATYMAGFLVQGGDIWSGRGLGLLAFAIVMSGWMGLVGAPAKDLPDMRGDAAAGRRTLAVLWGEANVGRFVAMCALALAGALVWTALEVAAPLLWPSMILMGGAVAVAVAGMTRFSQGDRVCRRLPYRVFMATQYAVHIAAIAVFVR